MRKQNKTKMWTEEREKIWYNLLMHVFRFLLVPILRRALVCVRIVGLYVLLSIVANFATVIFIQISVGQG